MMHDKDRLVPKLKPTNEHFRLNRKYIQHLLAQVLDQQRIKQFLVRLEERKLPTEQSTSEATKIYFGRFLIFVGIAGVIAMLAYLITILGH